MRILNVRLDGFEGDRVEVKDGQVVIIRGHFSDIMSYDRDYGLIQYDLDQHILEEARE